MKAIWHGEVIAESDDTVVVEGNHYFPANAVRQEVLAPSQTHTTCPWKGEARYHDVVIDGATNKDAAWYYPDPKAAAASVAGRIAFWRGIRVVPSNSNPDEPRPAGRLGNLIGKLSGR